MGGETGAQTIIDSRRRDHLLNYVRREFSFVPGAQAVCWCGWRTRSYATQADAILAHDQHRTAALSRKAVG